MGQTRWAGEHLWNLLNMSWSEFRELYPTVTKGTYKGKRAYWRAKIVSGEIPKPEAPEPKLVKTWESAAFNRETNEWETTTLSAYDHTAPEADLASLFIHQAEPTIINPTTVQKPTRVGTISLIAGDAQIGFRGDEAFHDERAMELFQIAVQEIQPDNIVFTGDMIDLPAQSKYEQRIDWQTTTQASIDRYHSFLAQTRANAPHAKIVVVHGNHEARMDSFIRRDASALLGLRRANAERELSVLTLQYLVRYGELEVESVDGYPNAAYWLEDNLKIQHGTNVKKGGSNANKYLNEEDTSTIFGHTHRVELAFKTIATRLGQRVIAAASPGCLARTEGYVPGYHYSVDNEGRTVPKAEDWQQGLLIVHHTPENHDIQPVRFHDGSMRLNDKVFRSSNG